METKTLSNATEQTITGAPIKIQITDGKNTWYTPLTTPECIVTPSNKSFQWITSIQECTESVQNTVSCIKIDYFLNGNNPTTFYLKGEKGDQGDKGDKGPTGPMPNITVNDQGHWVVEGKDTGKIASGNVSYTEL